MARIYTFRFHRTDLPDRAFYLARFPDRGPFSTEQSSCSDIHREHGTSSFIVIAAYWPEVTAPPLAAHEGCVHETFTLLARLTGGQMTDQGWDMDQ
jgi:hypothetical protein